jgi:hypothetical protein
MDPKDNSFWGRPAYLAQLKDGLLVSMSSWARFTASAIARPQK